MLLQYYNKSTVLLKIRRENIELRRILEVNIQYSIRAHSLFPHIIAHTRDDPCPIIRDYFNHSVKGAE